MVNFFNSSKLKTATHSIIFILSLIISFSINSKAYALLDNNYVSNLESNQNNSFKIFRLEEKDKIILKKSIHELKKYEWSKALSYANTIQEEALRDSFIDYILWKKYKKINISKDPVEFSNMIEFINNNPFVPQINSIKKKAESFMVKNKVPLEYTNEYFDKNSPKTLKMATYYIELEEKQVSNDSLSFEERLKLNKELSKFIKKTWVEKNFDVNSEASYLAKYYKYLKATDYEKRIDRLVWDKKYGEARRILRYIDKDRRNVFETRIKILQNLNAEYINHYLRKVPYKNRKDEGLMYARVKWLHKHKKRSQIVSLLLKLPKDLNRQDKWFFYRKYYARELLKTKDYQKAYLIVKNHGLYSGKDFAEGEWLSGWISLRFLDKPKTAYKHFDHLYRNVSYPNSVSRASYWAGRAAEAIETEDELALQWYNIALQYPTCFYGQLAIRSKVNISRNISEVGKVQLPLIPKISQENIFNVKQKRAIKLAGFSMLPEINDPEFANKLLRYAVKKSKNKGDVATIVKITKNFKNPRLTSSIARNATYKNVFFIEDNFPIIKIIENKEKNAHLIHSIIKQESGFHVSAISSAGATGFMQIMPATAKNVCSKMKVRYSNYKLKHNAEYNIKLGSYYINSLIDQFNGSEILAIAGYNAGPHSVKRWIKDYYDPRETKDIYRVIDWIELIPYPETRNYVQRIMEASVVYKHILKQFNE